MCWQIAAAPIVQPVLTLDEAHKRRNWPVICTEQLIDANDK